MLYKIALDDLIVDFEEVNSRLRDRFYGSSAYSLISCIQHQEEMWLLFERSEQRLGEYCFFVEPKGVDSSSLEQDILSHYQGEHLLLGKAEFGADEILLCYKSVWRK